ncbi:MAG: IgA Peptidase M64 [Acidobacteria bacterium]|nr:IgA Peptidase M64 [Acidobacteriota bacterium]
MIRKFVSALVATLSLAPFSWADETFDRNFDNATLRIDFFHTGNAEKEIVTFDRLYRQGEWAGPRTKLLDPFPYGSYLVEATDPADGSVLFSKGFDSYFGEYRTTSGASDGVMRTYHESVLLPFPRRPIEVRISARQRDSSCALLNNISVDPTSVHISTEPPTRDAVVVEVHLGGPAHAVLDITILGEGYAASEIETFKTDLEHASATLLAHPPFNANRAHISVRGVLAPSAESGCDEPSRGVYRSTSLGASFNSLGSERYMLTEDNRSMRDVAANAPYDALIIMVNHDRYGGGGIYNLFCTFTAHSDWADYLLLHEFGHSFAGLADEYYSSSVAYNDFYPRGHEPHEPNITALLDPSELKWRDLIEAGTALPTPWGKEAFDREDSAYQEERTELNKTIGEASRAGASEEKLRELRDIETRHAAVHSQWVEKYLASRPSAGIVGAFEGAGYSSTGLYRPMIDCLMFSRRAQPYCRVCERAVEAMILRYTE